MNPTHRGEPNGNVPILEAGVDDITVDLGPMPLDMAWSLLIAVCNTLGGDTIWERENFSNLTSLKAMLTYKIAKADQTAQWAEPA